MIHTAASLATLKISELKVIATELNVIPTGNKSRKQTWVGAILEHQVIVIPAAIESQPVIVVHSTFEDEDEPQAAVSLKPIQPQSPVLIALVVILAVVTAVRAVVIVGAVGFCLTVRGADELIGMYRRWSTVELPQPEPSMIPVSA